MKRLKILLFLLIPFFGYCQVENDDILKLYEERGNVIYNSGNWAFSKKNPHKYYNLYISGFDIKKIDYDVYNFSEISNIILTDVRMDLGINFRRFTKIRSVEFNRCNIEVIEKVLAQIDTNVTLKIVIDNVHFYNLPRILFKFNKLESIKFFNCTFDEIPLEFSCLSNLREVVLYRNFFSGMHDLAFSDLIYLERLSIVGTPIFSKLTVQTFFKLISFCEKLEEIELYDCGLHRFPYEFGNFKYLKELIISGNKIDELIDVDVGLCNLKVLNICNTNIRYIPERYRSVKMLIVPF